jgi:hypothetical protein
VEQTELRLLEAETEALRGKLPLRCEALEEARRNGEAAAPAPGGNSWVLGVFPEVTWQNEWISISPKSQVCFHGFLVV